MMRKEGQVCCLSQATVLITQALQDQNVGDSHAALQANQEVCTSCFREFLVTNRLPTEKV